MFVISILVTTFPPAPQLNILMDAVRDGTRNKTHTEVIPGVVSYPGAVSSLNFARLNCSWNFADMNFVIHYSSAKIKAKWNSYISVL